MNESEDKSENWLLDTARVANNQFGLRKHEKYT